MSDSRPAEIGRYQIVPYGKGEAVLLDTATGSSWSLARDLDTLQLGWRRLEERWPESAYDGADRPRVLLDKNVGGPSAPWWKARLGGKRQERASGQGAPGAAMSDTQRS